MTNEELIAQIDASYDIERVRGTALPLLAIRVGDADLRHVWRLAWICGHRAGLQAAKDVHTEVYGRGPQPGGDER